RVTNHVILRTEARLQRARKLLQRIVAGLMPVAIVDPLEIVEIEKEDRRSGVERLAQHAQQCAPVEKSGKRIVIDKLLQHALGREQAGIRLQKLALNRAIEDQHAAEGDDPLRTGVE